MRMLAVVVSAFVAVSLSSAVMAQDPPPPAPPVAPPSAPQFGAPPMGGPRGNSRMLRIGPNDSMGNAQNISGKMRLAVAVPPNTDVVSVEIYVDGKLLQTFQQKPFYTQFDTSTVSTGEHIFKGVGKNASGTITWTASTKANITKDNPQGNPPAQGNAPGAVGPLPSATAQAPSSATPGRPGFHQPVTPGKPAPVAESPAVNLGKTYTSKAYAITIKYPANWVVEDDTSKLTKKSDSKVWLVFGTSPISKSQVVVNLRKTPLAKGSTAETFAQYNDYVQSWEQRTIGGSPAFATTSGTPQSKRVVHRLILIKNGIAWMFNCIDTSGASPASSKAIFDAMVNSFQLQ